MEVVFAGSLPRRRGGVAGVEKRPEKKTRELTRACGMEPIGVMTGRACLCSGTCRATVDVSRCRRGAL